MKTIPAMARRVPTTTKASRTLLFLRVLVSWVKLDSVVPINTLRARPGSIPRFPRAKSLKEMRVRLIARLKVMKGMTGQRRTRKTSFMP